MHQDIQTYTFEVWNEHGETVIDIPATSLEEAERVLQIAHPQFTGWSCELPRKPWTGPVSRVDGDAMIRAQRLSKALG